MKAANIIIAKRMCREVMRRHYEEVRPYEKVVCAIYAEEKHEIIRGVLRLEKPEAQQLIDSLNQTIGLSKSSAQKRMDEIMRPFTKRLSHE